MDLWPKELEEQFKAGQIRIFPVNSVWGVDAVISPESRAEGVGGQKHPGISATDYDLFEEDTGRYIQQFPEWEMRRLVGDNRADPNAWRVIPWGVGDYKEAMDVLRMYESDPDLSSTEFLDMINRRGFFASTENRLSEQEGKSQLARILQDGVHVGKRASELADHVGKWDVDYLSHILLNEGQIPRAYYRFKNLIKNEIHHIILNNQTHPPCHSRLYLIAYHLYLA